MAVISSKPNTKLPWASQGNRAEPTSDKQLEGWNQEIPPHEMENWIQYKQDLATKYLYQEGIPEWDSAFEYNTTSYVKYDGVIYKLKGGAEVPNTAKQPDVETTSWEVAFEPYGSSAYSSEEIRKIKELEGYLSLYVSRANPVMEGVAIAPEFQATTIGGHTFQGAGADTGLFLNTNNEPEIKINNVTKATVRNSPSLTSSDTTLVTTSMLQQFKNSLFNTMFPIGISIITQDPRNPKDYLGFGSWERDLEGRALVGVTTDVTSASPDWVKTVNREFGEYTTTVSIPTDGWAKNGTEIKTSVSGRLVVGSGAQEYKETLESLTQTSVPQIKTIDIVQKSQTKFIWTRLS